MYVAWPLLIASARACSIPPSKRPRPAEVRVRRVDVGENDRSSQPARLPLQKNIRVIRVIRGVFKQKLPSHTSSEKRPRSSCEPAVALGEDGLSRDRGDTRCALPGTRRRMLGVNI